MYPEDKLAAIAYGDDVTLTDQDLASILNGYEEMDEALFMASSIVLDRTLGRDTYLHGIVQITNECQRNCYYCGLRRSNDSQPRFSLPFGEVMSSLTRGYNAGVRSFMLQSGELLDERTVGLVEHVLLEVEKRWGDKVGIALSIGEHPLSDLERFKSKGASRYLLRIESSDRELYMKLHPRDSIHRYSSRLDCLVNLQGSGWETGTGVLVGVPWQKDAHLAGDLRFMQRLDVDVCNMNPYVVHDGTPFAKERRLIPPAEERLLKYLRMIGLMRILMPDINIPISARLLSVHHSGPMRALKAGANAYMANLTPAKYRRNYDLYGGKPAETNSIEVVVNDAIRLCENVGRPVKLLDPGVSRHYRKRMEEKE